MDVIRKINDKVYEIRMEYAESTLNRATFLVNKYGLIGALFYDGLSFILVLGVGSVVILLTCLMLEALIL